MLLARIEKKLPQLGPKEWNQIVGMLIDEQFEVAEILEVLKLEELFEERMKEAEEALKSEDD